MWRSGLGGVYLLPALSLDRCLTNSTMLCFHIPLIEPDGRFSRIRLSEKGSRGRPRKAASPRG